MSNFLNKLFFFVVTFATIFALFYFGSSDPLFIKNEEMGEITGDIADLFEAEGHQKRLRFAINGKHWKLTRLNVKELVKGNKGAYFQLQLYNKLDQMPIRFEGGKYTIDDFEYKFNSGIRDFVRQVIEKVNNSDKKYEFFIRGSADMSGNQTFGGSFAKDKRYTSLRYLPKGKEYPFSNRANYYFPAEPFQNEDLPNLRGAFVQQKLANYYYSYLKSPQLLEGKLGLGETQELRSVEIFFFIGKK